MEGQMVPHSHNHQDSSDHLAISSPNLSELSDKIEPPAIPNPVISNSGTNILDSINESPNKKVDDNDTRNMLSHATRNLNLGSELDDSTLIDTGPSGSFNLKSLELIKSRRSRVSQNIPQSTPKITQNSTQNLTSKTQRSPKRVNTFDLRNQIEQPVNKKQSKQVENDKPKPKFKFLMRKSGHTTQRYSGSIKRYVHPDEKAN
jgi:hypothetical protein